jgi:hypothetical protein
MTNNIRLGTGSNKWGNSWNLTKNVQPMIHTRGIDCCSSSDIPNKVLNDTATI